MTTDYAGGSQNKSSLSTLRALKTSPLMEAIFEFRFQPAVPNAGDLLPGLLFGELGKQYPEVSQLPVGTVPREMREKEPSFLYQATYRLSAGSRVVQVGDRVVTLSALAPYPGWPKFKEATIELLQAVGHTRCIREPERFSFRYINVIPADPNRPQLPLLSVRTTWEGHDFVERGFQLRFELEEREFTTIVQISPHVAAKKLNAVVSGLMVDVDTIRANPPTEFWAADAPLLEDAHSVVKRVFFSILTRSTLEGLEPIYDTATI